MTLGNVVVGKAAAGCNSAHCLELAVYDDGKAEMYIASNATVHVAGKVAVHIMRNAVVQKTWRYIKEPG